MKLLLVTPMPPQRQAPGAIPVVLHAELTGLLERHQVSLATIAGQEPGEQEAVDRLSRTGVPVRAVKRLEPSGWERWQRRARFTTLWLRGRDPWRTVWFYEPGMQRLLSRWLAEESFDLVIVEDNAMGIYDYPTAAPLLFTEHEVRRPRKIRLEGIGQNPLRWGLREADWARWKSYQPGVWRKFQRIQAFTRRDADEIARLAPDLAPRVRVNPFGIDLPTALDAGREQPGSLLFVGNFSHPPNVDAALWLGREIMPALRARHIACTLTLVGIYPPKEVQQLESADIHIAGAVPEIEPYMERAAVVLAPVRTGGGMRMKVLHAMALGKAIVATPRGVEGLSAAAGTAVPVRLGDTGDEITRQIIDLLEHAEARREMGAAARRFVQQHFSAQAYAGRIEAIYAEMQAEAGLPAGLRAEAGSAP